MCIYLTGQTNLHYKKQEHIIPAGLGGMMKLANGVVSDEFNYAMSGLEKQYMSDSIFAGFARVTEGPGRSGSLSDQNQTRSNIHVLVNNTDAKDVTLGYIQKGVPINLPQFRYDIHTKAIQVQLKNEPGIQEKIDELIAICKSIATINTTLITSDLIPENTFLFGYKTEKKYNRAFFASNPKATFNFSNALLEEFGEKLVLDPNSGIKSSNHVISNRTNSLQPDFYRIPAKIAFNYLAHLYGADYVRNTTFDAIRSWIADGGDNQFVKLTQEKDTAIQNIVGLLPSSAHAVFISEGDGHIFGHVVIYGHWINLIVLTRNAPATHRNPTLKGLICDWKNRKEIDLDTFLNSLI
ncbi:hypothetical protein [Mucilaginibacter sp. UYCu711]|uniref:hypothetical protein n=1 Tax=Mucilaginibacter sp. UYCu711 TaxID=3156339 RepID=UPI003D1E33E1